MPQTIGLGHASSTLTRSRPAAHDAANRAVRRLYALAAISYGALHRVRRELVLDQHDHLRFSWSGPAFHRLQLRILHLMTGSVTPVRSDSVFRRAA